MSHLGLRIAVFLAVILILLVLVYACTPGGARTPVVSTVTAVARDTSTVLAKADKLPTGSQVERVISATPPAQPVAPQVAQPQEPERPVSRDKRPRPEGVGFCERYGLRKVVTEGGKSWRCRH